MASQGMIAAASMYNQHLDMSSSLSSYEPMMGVEVVRRVQKRPRSTITNDSISSSSSNMTYGTIISEPKPMVGISRTHRHRVKVVRCPQITYPSINSMASRRSIRAYASSVSMDNDILRLVNDMGRLTISSDASTDMPVELQKASLGGLVDRLANLSIKDDGAEDDGDIIMTNVSSILLQEPTYCFGVEERSTSTNQLVLSPTNKLRLHRQRRQKFMLKRQNKSKSRNNRK